LIFAVLTFSINLTEKSADYMCIFSAVKALIEAGANQNIKEKHGKTQFIGKTAFKYAYDMRFTNLTDSLLKDEPLVLLDIPEDVPAEM
jgi:hypothetical protein